MSFHPFDRALALIKPDAYGRMGEILDLLYQKGYSICRVRMLRLTESLAHQLLSLDQVDIHRYFFITLVYALSAML
jgi:nucleoside diphosphate kinase